MLELWTIIQEEQEPSGCQGIDETIEQGMRLGVDPVQVFEHQAGWLDFTLPKDEMSHRVQGLPTAASTIEGLPLWTCRTELQQRDDRRHGRCQTRIERKQPGADDLMDVAVPGAAIQTEVSLEEVHDGSVGGHSGVRSRRRVENEPAIPHARASELVQKPRLADTRLTDDADDLPAATDGGSEGAIEVRELGLAPHE